MMKTTTGKWILCLLFCLGLGLFLLLYLLLPQAEFSENEKRLLTPPPDLRVNTLLSGAFSEEAENWAADHMPARGFFVRHARNVEFHRVEIVTDQADQRPDYILIDCEEVKRWKGEEVKK